MRVFAALPAEERALYLRTYSNRRGIPEFIVEKDFWVCWLLAKIFEHPELGANCVFKGGTSLSKVFNAISRFSEDIDLGLSPESLGWKEADLDGASSRAKRTRLTEGLLDDCTEAVRDRFFPRLAEITESILGPPPGKEGWLAFEFDAMAKSPVILFNYPRAVGTGGYIAPSVKIEFGSLTDQRPVGTHSISPMLAELAPNDFSDFSASVVALEFERTFWEKATILHAEYHRPPGQPLRDRYARHYSDFAALWEHPGRAAAATRLDLLKKMRTFKDRFFRTGWSNYDAARCGTLRLVPPEGRVVELRRDYVAMEPMFLSAPPRFEQVLDVLRKAEADLNSK